GEAQVADGTADLAVLDEEGAVARHPREDRLRGMHHVHVPEARYPDAALYAAQQVGVRGIAGAQDEVGGQRAGGGRGGERVAGRLATVAGGRLVVVDDSAGDAPLEQADALLGRSLVVEGLRQPARIAAVVPEVHAWRRELLAQAATEETSPLLQRQCA